MVYQEVSLHSSQSAVQNRMALRTVGHNDQLAHAAAVSLAVLTHPVTPITMHDAFTNTPPRSRFINLPVDAVLMLRHFFLRSAVRFELWRMVKTVEQHQVVSVSVT